MSFNLDDPLTKIKGVSEAYQLRLSKLGITTIKDLITYFPRSYTDTSEISNIKDVILNYSGESKVNLKVTVLKFQNIFLRTGKTLQKILVKDSTGELECVFFNQKFLKETFTIGQEFLISGKISQKGKFFTLYPANYEIVVEGRENVHLARITPEYPLTKSVTKKWFRNRIKSVIDNLNEGQVDLGNTGEFIDNSIAKESISQAHFPATFSKLEKSVKQLSELELINLHLKILSSKKDKETPLGIGAKEKDAIGRSYDEFSALLPFDLTKDQAEIIQSLMNKLMSGELVNDLVQGDVGSGKTVIIMYLAYLFFKLGYQSVILVPTTILARQHFENFKKAFQKLDVSIGLFSSETKTAEHKDIVIGTTAIFTRKIESVVMPGIILVDEQHKFGVVQREDLLKGSYQDKKKKKYVPHFVNLTATPIPRTIAESVFGDTEVHTIHSKPAGRMEIKSFLVPVAKRTDSFKWIIDTILKKKQQVYWLAPLVEESETSNIKSVKTLYEELKEEFNGYNLELLHGKLKSAEKDRIMKEFSNSEIDILITTSVIEVGVDVPNATVMVVENAERFGLAQLHQIRGRIGRGTKQSYFFMFAGEETTPQSTSRLEFISRENDGLKVAEFDLNMRGPGEVYGTAQSGIPNLRIAKLNNLDQIRETKIKAKEMYDRKILKVDLFS